MANLHPRRHGALAAFLVVPFLAGQLLAAPPTQAAAGSPAPPATTGLTDAPKPLTAAQLSRRLIREVYGYLPYWELDSTTDAYLRYDLLSTISLFSFRYGSDGTIVATSAADRLVGPLGQTIIGHAHAAGVRVELAFSFSGVPAVNNDFFADQAATTRAIGETIALLAKTGADGVNLDVERLSNASFPAYGAFIGRLRKAVVARIPAGRVTVATNGAGSGALMAATAIANGADRAFLMGYSYRSSGSSPVGSNSPVVKSDGDWDITSSLAEYERRGVPLDRVILGLPYYGITRATVDASLHSARRSDLPSGARPCSWNRGYPTFLVRNQGAIPTDARIGYDAAEQSAWAASYDAAVGTWCQTYFDNPRSLRAKYDLTLSRGLGGVGMWALGYDRGQSGYWDAIASRFSIVRLAGSDRYETAAKIFGRDLPAGRARRVRGDGDRLQRRARGWARSGRDRRSGRARPTLRHPRRVSRRAPPSPARADRRPRAGRAPSPTASPRRCGRTRRPGGSIGSAGPTGTQPPRRYRPASSSPVSPWPSSGPGSTSLTRCPAQPPVGWTTAPSCLSGPIASRPRPRPSFDVLRRARSSSSAARPSSPTRSSRISAGTRRPSFVSPDPTATRRPPRCRPGPSNPVSQSPTSRPASTSPMLWPAPLPRPSRMARSSWSAAPTSRRRHLPSSGD